MKRGIWFTPLILVIFTLQVGWEFSGQNEIPNYQSARRVFWRNLYHQGGMSLYCQESVNKDQHNIEHVVPASWMKKTAGCHTGSRRQCRKKSRLFNLMEADLHNLYPVRVSLNAVRSNYPYAILPGRVESGCDFEIDRQINAVEPSPAARGKIARAMLYMQHMYGVDLSRSRLTHEQTKLMLSWHCQHPVDESERQRHETAASIQGQRNDFIDNPERVDCSVVSRYPAD